MAKDKPNRSVSNDQDLHMFIHLLASLARQGIQDSAPSENNNQTDFAAGLAEIFATATLSTQTLGTQNFSYPVNAVNTGATSLASRFETASRIDTGERTAIRANINESIGSTFKQLEGTRYAFGGKGKNGIDCSGFVAKAVSDTVRNVPGIDPSFAKKFATNSEGQLANMIAKGVPIIRENNLRDCMRGGLVIAMDTGDKGFDAGRKYGIDHVVTTYEDEKGQVFVVESRGGKGVMRTPAEDWLKMYEAKGAKLYAADLVAVAEVTMAAATTPQPSSAPKLTMDVLGT